MENFEDSEWLDDRTQKRTRTKDEALYGVFAGENSDSDYESKRKRRKKGDVICKSGLTKPVYFVSTGVPSQVIDADKRAAGLGFREENDEFLPSELGKRVREGAERRVKDKVREMDHPESGKIGAFEEHTKGIGMKILKQMGYIVNEGLGRFGQGIVAPVEAELRPKNAGLGFNTKPAPKKVPEEISVARVVHQPAAAKAPLWSKKAPPKKSHVITADELLQRKQEQNLERVNKVIDMRGPQVRVLTSLENLNARIDENDDVPMPELQYNVEVIMGSLELDIEKIGRDLTNERETFASLQREREKIRSDLSEQETQLNNMQKIASVVKRVEEESSTGILTLESLAESFLDMHTNFGDDYKLCNLSSIACSYALPLFFREFQWWNPLENPRHGLDIVSQWKSLLHEDSADMFASTSPYTQLIMEVVFPAVRISGTNSWQTRYPEPMLEFLDSWESLLTPGVHQLILDSIVMPKLSAAVNSWEPCKETEPIHWWVHPWLPRLGNKLEPCYQAIRDKLGKFLRDKWDPMDRSAYEKLVEPWRNVFDAGSWDKLMARAVAPKLLTLMQGFQINPANQTLDEFSCVMIWATAIPIQHMIVIMDVFFAKWYQVLHHWLNSRQADFKEVREWYLGWKSLLPNEVSANEHVRSRLMDGLAMMQRAVEGKPVALPGHLFPSQKKKVEERQFQKAARGADSVQLSLKEVVEVYAQQNGLTFQPKPGRMHDGHQIYGFGNINITIDAHNQNLTALMDNGWRSVYLEQLQKLAVLKKH